MEHNRLVAERDFPNFAAKFNFNSLLIMVLVYIIVAIAIVHLLFLLYPVYRYETLDVYSWTPWTEKEYRLFKDVMGNTKAVRIRLLINWMSWPFLLLFILVMPIVFLFKLPGILKEYDGEITYSKDGKTLLKVAENCRRVKVRKGVEVIASRAFDSTKVRHIELPNTVRILKANALLRAHDLESINLPDSIVRIDDYAFHFCGGFGKGLRKIVLPKYLHTLGEAAFYGCDKLERLTIRGNFMWKPSWMEENPFYDTISLAVIKNSNPNFMVEDGMLMSADGKILFKCVNHHKRVVVKDGVETIAQGAFHDMKRMEEVALPASLRTICRDAFRGCRNLDNVEIPEGLLSIGADSFSFCWNLKTMTLPASLKIIGYGAFGNSDHLTNFVYPKEKERMFSRWIEDGKNELPF